MWQQGKEIRTFLLCEVQLHTTLWWPSRGFCVLIACCPIHLTPQRLTKLNKRETKRSANEMLICWQSLRNAKVMQNSNTVVPVFLIPPWSKPIYAPPSENFTVHEVEKWSSVSSLKSWSFSEPMLLHPKCWNSYFIHYNCGVVKNDKERIRYEVRKITSLTNSPLIGAGPCGRRLRFASQLTKPPLLLTARLRSFTKAM